MSEQNTGWRDISTAPKDGTVVLVREDDGCIYSASFCPIGQSWKLADQDGSRWYDDLERVKHWQPLPPPPGEEGESDEVIFDDGFNPFMYGYDVDPDGPQNQVPPFRASDIERGLILLRTSSNAHGYTNCVVLTDRIEKLPAKGRQELARMMRNIATEIDGPSPLQARCAELEAAGRHVKRVCEESATLLRDPKRTGDWPGAERVASQFDRCADRLRSVVDGGE